jgi:hypothetical protein
MHPRKEEMDMSDILAVIKGVEVEREVRRKSEKEEGRRLEKRTRMKRKIKPDVGPRPGS